MYRVPPPKNEPVRDYAPGSDDRAKIVEALAELKKAPIEIPLVIDGKEIKTGEKIKITAPHNHDLVLGYYHQGSEKEVKMAVE